MIYLDTSWLVKLYIDEGDASRVQGAVDEGGPAIVSDLSFVEFHALVERQKREGLLAAETVAEMSSRFRREWVDRARIAVSADVLGKAADLVATHPLRSLDAIHLASALLAAAGSPEGLRFGAADRRLVAAAKAEGLEPATLE